MIANTGKSIQVLKARLERVIQSSDQLHVQIYDPREQIRANAVNTTNFSLFEEIPIYLKLNLKNKKPPVTLSFKTMQKGQIFEVYWSGTHKEPNEEKHDGMKIRVSKKLIVCTQVIWRAKQSG